MDVWPEAAASTKSDVVFDGYSHALRVTGIEERNWIKEAFPEVKVLIVTTFQDTEYIVQAVQNGVSIITKTVVQRRFLTD